MNKPRILIRGSDHRRLTDLANGIMDRHPGLADELLCELERATVVDAAKVSPASVQMGATVAYRSDDGQRRRVTLVYPGEADIAQGRISVLTPIGTALLGLSVGQSIGWTANDGRQHRLTVEAVGAVERTDASVA